MEVHQSWDRAVEREKQNRTRFAQRAIKPDEIKQELEESDRVLGSQDDVKEFVLNACGRLNCPLVKKKQGWLLSSIPQQLEFILGSESRLITFDSPAPEGVEYIGRNHPIVEGLARYLLEQALTNTESPIASRCGFTVTDAVDKPTTILLLRLRHLLSSPRNQDLLAMDDCDKCLLEFYHQQTLQQGGRVRDRLRDGVEEALKILGTGFLQHHKNQFLRDKVAQKELCEKDYYRQLLLLIYRLLFLMVAESRNMLLIGEEEHQARIYTEYYSIERLRALAERPIYGKEGFQDKWQGLLMTFRLFDENWRGIIE